MDFMLTEDQQMLEAAARRFFEDSHPRRLAREIPNVLVPETLKQWNAAREMGFHQLLAPSGAGGLGMGYVEAWLVQEAAGRSLFSLPLAESMLLTAALHASPHASGFLEDCYVGGASACTFFEIRTAARAGCIVGGVDGAEDLHFIVPLDVGPGSCYLRWPQAEAEKLQGTEPCRRRFVLKGSPSLRIELPDVPFCALEERLKLLRAAESVGAAFQALEMTSQYAGERVQFGKPIGVNQGIKHRLADRWVALDNARLAGLYAGSVLDAAPGDAAFPVAAVVACAAEAAQAAVADAIQFHGALGFSWEHDAHLFFKRVMHIHAYQGATDLLFERIWSTRR